MSFPIFVATRPEQVPARCSHFISVDGAVPGAALTWDHHQTGERINLDAMPRTIDAKAYDGVGTTLPDTDALASVVAVLMGGVGSLSEDIRSVLESASHHCDHLVPHPAHDQAVNARGRGLDNFVGGALAAVGPARRSATFSRLCRLVHRCVRDGQPLPEAAHPAWSADVALVEAAGGLTLDGHVLIVDLPRALRAGTNTDGTHRPARRRLSVRPDAWYLTRPSCTVAVIIDRHPRGGVRYTIGHNPFHPSAAGGTTDMRPVLERLAKLEFEHGAPALAPRAAAGCENWGGRKEVGGSPWNYGSRLSIADVLAGIGAGT